MPVRRASFLEEISKAVEGIEIKGFDRVNRKSKYKAKINKLVYGFSLPLQENISVPLNDHYLTNITMKQNKTLEFRLYYFTKNYQETIAFYRDVLELEIIVQSITNTSYCHRNFKVEDPNGMRIGYFSIKAKDMNT
jgi:hypothetical protein